MKFIQKNADRELPNTTLALRQFVSGQVNMVLAIGTNTMGKELDLARSINPKLKAVLMIVNPGAPNSEYEAEVLRKEANEGFLR